MVEEKKTQIPKDIIDGMKKLSEVTSTPIQSLLDRLKEIKATDENIQAMEHEDFKIRFAWAILYREFAVRGAAEDFYVMPLLTPNPREFKDKKSGEMSGAGELTALIQKLEKDESGTIVPGEVKYASGTFWRAGAKNLAKLERGKVYRATMLAKPNSWGMEITSDRATFSPVEYKFPITLAEFYEKEIAPKSIEISLGEIDLNISESTTDIRVSTVTAFDSNVGEKDGREFGYYDLMDHSIVGSNHRMFVHPKDVEFLQGSILKVGYRVTEDDKTKVIRLNPHFVLPTGVAEKREMVTKKIGNRLEPVDVSTLEDLPKEPATDEVNFEV